VINLLTRLARVRRLGHGEEATLVEHLTELRDRLIACVVLLGIVFAVAFWRYHDLFQILNAPLPDKLQESKPITTEIGEAFTLTIMISVYTALLITFPFTLYQLYSYLIPAFTQETSKRLKPLLMFIPLLFSAGAAFGYFVVVPSAVRFLYYWASDEVNPLPRARSIYPFEMTMMFVMGIIFEMPAAVWVLTRLHVLSSRVMKRNRRIAIVVLAASAAALPGTDPVSMLLELVPLLLLFEVSIWVARGVERARDADEVGDVSEA
jgi:sec-independent protein translocase protein TatC